MAKAEIDRIMAVTRAPSVVAPPCASNDSFAEAMNTSLAPRCRGMERVKEAVDIAQLYRHYGPFVLRRCRHLLNDEHQAREAMQDVFLQMLRRKEHLRGEGLGALLYRAATNVCLNRIRSRRRRPHDPAGDLLERIADAATASHRNEARNLLQRALAREPESTAVIAVLHLHDGLTLEQTAKMVGMSISGVRHRLRALKATLEELRAQA